MAFVKIKMISGVAASNFSYAPGEIVEVEEGVAANWIAAGAAIDAPDFEVSAHRVVELEKRLADMSAARDGLSVLATNLEGKLAAAIAEKKGAIAEMAVHRKAAQEAYTRAAGLERELEVSIAAEKVLERNSVARIAGLERELAASAQPVLPQASSDPAKELAAAPDAVETVK